MPCNVKSRTMFTGDNLFVLRGIDSESVDLIYLDPPFNSKREYSAPIGSRAAGAAFKDTWELQDTALVLHGEIAEANPALYLLIDAAGAIGGKSDKAYLIYMAVRLMEMHRVLKETGSIYLHCDQTMSHPLKMLMDGIFGPSRFRREVVWSNEDSSGFKSQARNWIRGSDSILYYVKKVGRQTFNKQHDPLSEQALRGYSRSDGRGRYKLYRERGSGRERRVYLKDNPGVPMRNVWTDIASFQTASRAGELVNYPTQKPLALLERIVRASSNEGDLVLDPFCGCATACVAAERLGRGWIGIDVSEKAVQLVKERLSMDLHIDGEGVRERLLVAAGKVIHRTDAPARTDVRPARRVSRGELKREIYGRQEGVCGGCLLFFPIRNMEMDHVVSRSRGGQDNPENFQLLCGACNRKKGAGTQEELVARLMDEGIRTRRPRGRGGRRGRA